jgi:hypothetical protein
MRACFHPIPNHPYISRHPLNAPNRKAIRQHIVPNVSGFDGQVRHNLIDNLFG